MHTIHVDKPWILRQAWSSLGCQYYTHCSQNYPSLSVLNAILISIIPRTINQCNGPEISGQKGGIEYES